MELSAATPSYHILNYPFSTRSAAMGGTRAAHDLPALDVQGNPASYSFSQTVRVHAGFVNHLVGINGYSSAAVLPLEQHRIYGEMVYFDYGLFDGTDELGNPLSSFGFHEIVVRPGYAYLLNEKIRLGARLGLYQRVADGQTHTRRMTDLGAVYHSAEDSITVGLYLSNFTLQEGEEEVPGALRIGTSKILTYLPLRLNIDGEYSLNEDWLSAIGGEIMIHPQFRVRLGINTRRFDLQTGVNSEDFLAGASAGFVLDWKGILMESAMQNYGAAGMITQLSLGYSF